MSNAPMLGVVAPIPTPRVLVQFRPACACATEWATLRKCVLRRLKTAQYARTLVSSRSCANQRPLWLHVSSRACALQPYPLPGRSWMLDARPKARSAACRAAVFAAERLLRMYLTRCVQTARAANAIGYELLQQRIPRRPSACVATNLHNSERSTAFAITFPSVSTRDKAFFKPSHVLETIRAQHQAQSVLAHHSPMIAFALSPM